MCKELEPRSPGEEGNSLSGSSFFAGRGLLWNSKETLEESEHDLSRCARNSSLGVQEKKETVFLAVHFSLAGASFEIQKKPWKKANTIYRDVQGTRASESRRRRKQCFWQFIFRWPGPPLKFKRNLEESEHDLSRCARNSSLGVQEKKETVFLVVHFSLAGASFQIKRNTGRKRLRSIAMCKELEPRSPGEEKIDRHVEQAIRRESAGQGWPAQIRSRLVDNMIQTIRDWVTWPTSLRSFDLLRWSKK